MKVKKKKRTPLTIANKLDIIHKLESGVSPAAICRKFKVAKQTVSDIKKKKSKIENYARGLLKDNMPLNEVAMKKYSNSQEGLEKELIEWCFDQSSKGLLILSSDIQATALRLAQDRGLFNFSASNDWLWRFLQRSDMTATSRREISPMIDEIQDDENALSHKDYSSIVGGADHINNVLVKKEVISEDENGYNFEETSSLAEYSHIIKDEPHNNSEEEHNASDSESLNSTTIKLPKNNTNRLDELEKQLYEWWSDQKKKYLLIRPSKIQAKALQLAKDRGLVNFSASNRWLWRFLKRNNMTKKLRREKSPVFHEEIEKEKDLGITQENDKDFNTTVDSESSNCSTVHIISPHVNVFNRPSTSYTQSSRDTLLPMGCIDEYDKPNKVWSNKQHAKKSRSILKANHSKLLKGKEQLSEEIEDRGRKINDFDQNYPAQRLVPKKMDRILENGERNNNGSDESEEYLPLSKKRKIEMEKISRRIQNNTNLRIDGIVSSLNRIEEQFCKMNQNLEIIAKALTNK